MRRQLAFIIFESRRRWLAWHSFGNAAIHDIAVSFGNAVEVFSVRLRTR